MEGVPNIAPVAREGGGVANVAPGAREGVGVPNIAPGVRGAGGGELKPPGWEAKVRAGVLAGGGETEGAEPTDPSSEGVLDAISNSRLVASL